MKRRNIFIINQSLFGDIAYMEISNTPKIDLKYVAEAYLEPCQASKMERFRK